jgi:hypothetical protein
MALQSHLTRGLFGIGRLRAAFWTLLVAVVPVVPAWALNPRDELLRLVSDDVGFCLVVQDMRGHFDQLLDSPFVAKLRASPLGEAVAKARETQKLVSVEAYFRANFHIDWTSLRNDILGDAVVLAYWPGSEGNPDRDQGIALVRAGNAQVLADLMRRLDRVQPESQVRKHGDVEYVYWSKGQSPTFYYLHGPLLAITQKEEVLWRIMERDRLASQTAEPPVTSHLRRLGVENALAALWINPRAFEPEIQRKASQVNGPEAFVLNTVLTYWHALDGIALYGTLHKADLELGMVVQAQPERLPPAAQKLLVKELRPSDLWRYFPDNALLAVAGRVDAVAVTELVGSFLPGEVRATVRETVDRGPGAVLGKRDVVGEVLPCVGPDWGFCVLVPPANGDVWVPSVLAALRIQPGDKGVPLDQAALQALNTLSQLAVISYNAGHKDLITLQTEMQDKVQVTYLANEKLFLPGFNPAYALKDGYLVVASSPTAIRSFRAAPAPAAAGSPKEILLLRMALGEVRRYLKDRATVVATFLAEKSQVPPEEVRRHLNGLVSVLDLLDRLEVRQRSAAAQVALILRIRPSQPLAK